jgi:tripartite-type tricarboxylate transporter receptor subunit TctC
MLVRIAIAAVLALAAGAAAAQAWPAKAVRFVVPFPPGGATDVAARALADKLAAAFGQQVVVENRAGGGGAIGAAEVARAAPDGYVLLFTADPMTTQHLVVKALPYDVMRDFVPVTQVTIQPIAIAVHPSVGASTIQEFVALAKASPGKYSFAHSGTGSGQHMAGELFKRRAGIEMVDIPYRGGGPAVADLLGGQVLVGVLGSTRTTRPAGSASSRSPPRSASRCCPRSPPCRKPASRASTSRSGSASSRRRGRRARSSIACRRTSRRRSSCRTSWSGSRAARSHRSGARPSSSPRY